MKLISLNSWGCRVKDSIFEFINANSESTDIFCFQEILKGGAGKTNREETKSANEDIGELLKNHVGYFWEYGEGGYYNESSKGLDFKYGIACFVRNNLQQSFINGIHLYDNDKKWSDYSEGFAAGAAMTIKIEGYLLGNVHGLWQGSIKTDTEAKIEQSSKIIDLAESVLGKKVICGDFNLLPNTRSIEMLDERYNNLIKKYDIKSTRSSFYAKENKFADYIFTSPEIKINNFKVLPDEVSDHLPLFLDFD